MRITVISGLTNEAQTNCTTANLLLGAIAKENQLNGRSVTFKDQREAAIAAPGHVFHFKQQAAIDNILRTYNEVDLARVRDVLSPLSTDALPRVPPNNLNTMIPGSHRTVDGALACVLIERASRLVRPM